LKIHTGTVDNRQKRASTEAIFLAIQKRELGPREPKRIYLHRNRPSPHPSREDLPQHYRAEFRGVIPPLGIRVVVVEKDPEQLGKSIVDSASSWMRWPLEYFVEEGRGISFARNTLVRRASNSDFIAFIDDDEVADSKWLDSLLNITRQPINDESRTADTMTLPTLEGEMSKAYKELFRIYKRLEKHYRDMQDIEFTIQDGTHWMLQTRNGKRTTGAAVRIAVDMARERLITREEAILRVDANSLDYSRLAD